METDGDIDSDRGQRVRERGMEGGRERKTQTNESSPFSV